MENHDEDEFVVDINNTTDTPAEDKQLRDLEEQNKFLRDKLFEVLQRQDKLESDINKLKRTVSEKEQTIQILQSQAKHISKTLDTLETETHNTHEELQNEIESLKQELAVQFVGNEDSFVEDETVNKLQKSAALNNSCKLEQLSYLDEQVRDEEFSKPLYRAVFIWENWSDLAESTFSGSMIDSGDIRRFLVAKEDQQIDYNLVYRAMEVFDDKTNSNYSYVQDNNGGRKLIKERE